MKLIEKIKLNKEREILFFNKPIVRYVKGKSILFGNFNLFPFQSLREKILCDIIARVDSNCKKIFLVRSGLGELYLLNCYYNQIIENENVIFISRRKSHTSLFELFGRKNIKILNIDLDEYKLITNIKKYKYKGYEFEVFLPRCEILNILKKLKSTKTTFPNEFYDYFNISPNDKCEALQTNLINFNLTAINLKKFVFVSTESISASNIDKEQWQLIIDHLSLNFDVVINDNIQNFNNVKCFNLSIKDSVKMASNAQYIIGIRSGFTELLSTLTIPKFILYTGLKEKFLTKEEMLISYSLKNYPNVNADFLNEYIDINKFINKILEL